MFNFYIPAVQAVYFTEFKNFNDFLQYSAIEYELHILNFDGKVFG